MMDNRDNCTKKMCALALVAAMTFSLSACGGSSSIAVTEAVESTELQTEVSTESVTEAEETTAVPETTEAAAETYAVPDDFTKGYKQADYAYYSDEDNAEGAKGDKIWIMGALTKIGSIHFDNTNSEVAIFEVQDQNQNCWYIYVDGAKEEISLQTEEYDLEKNGLVIDGVYVGITDDKDPTIVMNKWFQTSDGSTYVSQSFGSYTYEETTEAETTEAKENEKEENSNSGDISPEFKAAMDEYEAFFDEYVDFIANYDASDTSQALKYLSFLSEYAETLQAFEEWDDKEMTDAEALYYAEVSLRISEKLLKVGESLG